MSSALANLRNKRKTATPEVDVQVKETIQPEVVEEQVYDRYKRTPGNMETIIEEPRDRVVSHGSRQYQNPNGGRQEVTHVGQQRSHQTNLRAQEYEEDVRPMHVVSIPSKIAYSVPDRVGLSVIGMNDPTRVRLLKPAPLDVEPLVLNNIRDTTGTISNRLVSIMHDTGSAVLPLRECNVFDNITSIPDFDILEIKGRRFASYTGIDYPATYLDQFLKRVIDKILVAQPFGVCLDNDLNTYYIDNEEATLKRTITIGSAKVEVPSLCVSQLNYIYAYLRFYDCNIIDVENDYPKLVVGIDLEGLPCEMDAPSTAKYNY